MPYDPQARFDIGGSVAAGQAMVSPLRDAIQTYLDEKRKTQFNQGAFDGIAASPEGTRYLTPEILSGWHSWKPDKQAGFLSATAQAIKEEATYRRQQEHQQRGLDMQWKIANMRDTPDPNALRPQPLIAPDGTALDGMFAMPKTGAVIDTRSKEKPDTMETLNSHIRSASGADMGAWKSGNPYEKNGFMVVDLSEPDIWGNPVKKSARLPKPLYQKYMGLYDTLSGVQSNAPAAAPAAAAPSSGPRQIASKQEFDALPSGTVFIAPDGSTRKKP